MRLHLGTMCLSVLCAFAASVSPTLAGDVLFARSMETRQLGAESYVVTCTVEFTGVEPRHQYLVNLFAEGTGIAVTFPYGGEIGPDQRTFVIDEPGVTRFEATLRGKTLSAERLLYITGPLVSTTTLYCQGGVGDLTIGGEEGVLGRVQMSDIVR